MSTDTEWPEIVSPTTQRVVSSDGTYVTTLEAGVSRRVHPAIFQACLEAGCSVPGQPVQGTALSHEETIDALVAAVQDVYAANNSELLRKDNRPRISAVKNRMHAPFSDEQLEEALQQVLIPELQADGEDSQ